MPKQIWQAMPTKKTLEQPLVALPSPTQRLCATEQELHVLRGELLHGRLVLVDGAVDHVGLLLLQHYHARFDRVFDTQTSDDTRPLLTDTVATIRGLPFSCRVPPPENFVSQ